MVKEMAAKEVINLINWLHLRMMENRPETEEKEISGVLEEKKNGKKIEVTSNVRKKKINLEEII